MSEKLCSHPCRLGGHHSQHSPAARLSSQELVSPSALQASGLCKKHWATHLDMEEINMWHLWDKHWPWCLPSCPWWWRGASPGAFWGVQLTVIIAGVMGFSFPNFPAHILGKQLLYKLTSLIMQFLCPSEFLVAFTHMWFILRSHLLDGAKISHLFHKVKQRLPKAISEICENKP